MYSRVRLRIHLLKKDVKRLSEKAEALASGAELSRDTTRPADKKANPEFWKAWEQAESRNWSELQKWQATLYLAQNELKEPKVETNKARTDRRKRRMEEDPEYKEKIKGEEETEAQRAQEAAERRKIGSCRAKRTGTGAAFLFESATFLFRSPCKSSTAAVQRVHGAA